MRIQAFLFLIGLPTCAASSSATFDSAASRTSTEELLEHSHMMFTYVQNNLRMKSVYFSNSLIAEINKEFQSVHCELPQSRTDTPHPTR